MSHPLLLPVVLLALMLAYGAAMRIFGWRDI